MNMDFSEYQNYIQGVDVKVAELSDLHKEQMKCGKGCDLCCLDFSVFPVEYYYIKEQMNHSVSNLLCKENGEPGNSKWCALLNNHACSIYPYRPYICRTHGLPLVYINETSDEAELSFCELNFTEVDDDYFDMENVWEQDGLNRDLFMINQRFLMQNPHLNHNATTLIPLRKLLYDSL